MTTPDVPYRYETSFEVPGTPEQVWQAIATANGISSWMLVTDLEERVSARASQGGGEREGGIGPPVEAHQQRGLIEDVGRRKALGQRAQVAVEQLEQHP